MGDVTGDTSPPGRASARDPVMDFTRVLCIGIVVIGHLLMVGASLDASRGLSVELTLLDQPWFGPITWIAQIMPLFFVVGGFTGIGSWRRLEASGGSAADFIRGRVIRLARPTIPLLAMLAVANLVMHLTGVAPTAIVLIGIGISSPLWFLAAYTFTQAYLPGMATLHRRFPIGTLVTLVAGSALLDALRLATGVPEVGLISMVFVWLFVQQIGFWLADGWFARRSRWVIAAIAAAAYALLALLVAAGYSASMLDNLNPPTFPVLPLAIGQTCVLVLAAPAIQKLMGCRVARLVTGAIGARLMTIYLWHLPVMGLILGMLLLSPLATPQPGSAAWWWTRPIILALIAVALLGISAVLGRLERAPSTPPGYRASDWATGLSTVLIVLPLFAITLFGITFEIAAVGALLLTTAVLLQRPRTSAEPAPSVETLS